MFTRHTVVGVVLTPKERLGSSSTPQAQVWTPDGCQTWPLPAPREMSVQARAGRG